MYHHGGKQHPKEDMAGRVPVQVKGHIAKNINQDEITFPVEVADLRNFLTDGGTIFFVVCFDEEGENEVIYWAPLLPFDLNNILESAGEQKSKSIHLKPFPTNKEDCTNIVLNFLNDKSKQHTVIAAKKNYTYDELVKDGKLPELTFGFTSVKKEDQHPLGYLFRNGMYLYAKIDPGILFPIEHVDRLEVVVTERIADIRVDNTVYYRSYKIAYRANGVAELHFGRSTNFTCAPNSSTAKFSFTLKGNLSERITDNAFIISALEKGGFYIGKSFVDMHSVRQTELQAFDIPMWKRQLAYLRMVKETFNNFSVTDELDMDNMKKADFQKLSRFMASVVEDKWVSLCDIGQPAGFYSIANLNILIWIKKDPKVEKYKILNFFVEKPPIRLALSTDDGKEWDCPTFVLLNKEGLIKCSNFNPMVIVKQIINADYNEPAAERIISFLLDILCVYDSNPQKNSSLLDAADVIIQAIKKKDHFTPEDILRLNELQIIKRQRGFNVAEKFDLMNIAAGTTDEEIKKGAYILLDEPNEAGKHYCNLSCEKQKVFSTYPIFTLWKRKTTQEGN